MLLFYLLTSISFLFQFGSCVVYDHLDALKQDQFDFVIVGGGTAGAVLASRLSEVASFQTLVIEAGPSHQDVFNTQVPFFWSRLMNSPYDWNFTTTPQAGLNGRSIVYARGHILGGSSSINAMAFTRGTADDYNRWATVTGDPGWSWNAMLPYFKKQERWIQPAEPRDIKGDFNPAFHGFNGKTLVSLPGHLQDIDARVISAAKELGGEFSYNLDMNAGNPLGITWFQGTIGNGERSSSATSYLNANVLKRSNLHVLLNTRVTRVLPMEKTDSSLKFGKVEVFGDGHSRTIEGTKEILLAAGGVASPQILLHSGIGDEAELKSIGIEPILNLPSVGKNLTDHPLFFLSFKANTTTTVDSISTNATLFAEAFDEWKRERKGPMTNGFGSNIAWLRLPENSSALVSQVDPSAGRNSPHWEFGITDGGSQEESRVSGGVSIVSPASRGNITINSTNPLDAPMINPGLLTADIDMVIAREAIRAGRRFFSAKAWEGYVLEESSETIGLNTDEEIDAYVRQVVATSWHPVGTAAMSQRGAQYGVVDPDLKMKNAEGLRVVDASVMPYIIAGHTQAPVYFIAERAADMIKQDWLRRSV